MVLFTYELCPKKERLNKKVREPINKPIRGLFSLLLLFHAGAVLEIKLHLPVRKHLGLGQFAEGHSGVLQ